MTWHLLGTPGRRAPIDLVTVGVNHSPISSLPHITLLRRIQVIITRLHRFSAPSFGTSLRGTRDSVFLLISSIYVTSIGAMPIRADEVMMYTGQWAVRTPGCVG